MPNATTFFCNFCLTMSKTVMHVEKRIQNYYKVPFLYLEQTNTNSPHNIYMHITVHFSAYIIGGYFVKD